MSYAKKEGYDDIGMVSETQVTPEVSVRFGKDTVLVVPDFTDEGVTTELGECYSWEQLVDIFDRLVGLDFRAMMEGRGVSSEEKIEKGIWWERFRDLASVGIRFGASKMFRNELVNYNPERHEMTGEYRTASVGEFYRVARSGCVREVVEERVNAETGERNEVIVESVLVKARVEPYGWR